MSKIQMGHCSAKLIQFLAENGPRSLAELLQQFPSQTLKEMRSRVRNLEHGFWLQRVAGGDETVYQIHPNADKKLPEIGIYVPAAQLKRGRGRPREMRAPLPASVVQPRRVNMWALGTYTGAFAAPTRPGAMDFLSYPSRGMI